MLASLTAWLVIFLLPFIYFFSEIHATLILELAGAAGAVACGVMVFSGKLCFNSTFRAGVALLLTWLFLAGRSIYVSVDPSISWPVFIKAAALGMLCLLTASAMAISRNYRVFYQAAAWAGMIHGMIALQEYVEAPPIPATWLDPAAASLFRTRCAGIFTDPNIFAAFLAVMFLLTIGLMLIARDRSERILAGLSLTWEGFAILTTLSRGGWIGLGGGILALSILLFKGGFKLEIHARRSLTAVAIVLLLIFFAGPFKMRLFSIGNPSDMTFAQRTLINRGIFRSIERFPIAGHGLHCFNQVYPRYRIVGGDYPMNAHNEFVHSMMETGFLSAMVLGVLSLLLLKSAFRALPGFFPGPAIFGSALFSLFVQNLSGFSSRIMPTSALIALAAGGILSFSAKSGTRSPTGRCRKAAALALFCIAAFIVGSGINAFSIQQQIQNAGDSLRSGQPAMAIKILRDAAIKEPANPTVYSMMATAFYNSGDLSMARQMWQKAAKINPSEAVYFINLARLAIQADPAEAERLYQQTLLLDPAAEQYRLEFARFLISLGRNSEALAQLLTGLSLSPGFHDVYTGFAEIEKLKVQLSGH